MSFAYQLYYEIRHSGKPAEELKKIAIRKDLWIACLAGSIHFVPITAALVLVVLNWRGYYVGGELEGIQGQDDAKFLALQFAAKLHELTISASLTAVIFSYIRHELVTDNGLPFGALVAGLQFKDVSYLWSTEFWGAMLSKRRRWRQRTALGGLIVVCAALSVSAGPSSATLMKPRLDYWPAGGTDFWIALPHNELFSTHAFPQVPTSCMVDTGNLSCPSAGWQALTENYMSFYQSVQRYGYIPDTVQLSGNKAIRTLRAFHRSPYFQFSTNTTSATIGSSSVADGLVETGRLWAFAAYNWRKQFDQRFWSRKDVKYSVQAQQPVVSARCDPTYDALTWAQVINTTRSLLIYDLWDDSLLTKLGDFPSISYNYTKNEQVTQLIDNLNARTAPELVWTTVPQSNGTATGLGVFIFLPLPQNNSGFFACTIDARMAPGSLQSTRNTPLIVTGADHGSTYDNNNTLPRISIEPAWATYLNPTINSNNSTAFQEMMRAAGIWDREGAANLDDIPYIIESLLSLAVVNGLARRDFGIGLSGTLLGNTDGLDLVSINNDDMAAQNFDCDAWCKPLLPSVGHVMGHGGSAFNISDSVKRLSTRLTMQACANGWAYNVRGSAAKFAIIALLLYTCIAISHWLCTTFWRKESSSSWDTVSELVALAMRSDPSETFVNTGAGIDSLAIFKQRTQVINKDDRLQLAVGISVGQDDMIEPNEYYG